MKKFTYLFVLLAILAAFAVVNAEDMVDIEIGTTGYLISIPADYVEGEVTEEEAEDDQIAYYFSENHLMDFDIYQFPAEGQALMDYAAEEAAEYGQEEVFPEEINGIELAYYFSAEEYDGETFPCVTYIWEAGEDFVEIAFWIDGDDAIDLIADIITTLVREGVPEAAAELDLTVAEPFLGPWYITEICGSGQCMDAGVLGMTGMSVDLKEDGTVGMTLGDQEPGVVPWYTEDGTAYICNGSEEEGCTWLPLSITEEGKLSMGDDSSALVFTREEVKALGTADVKTDAAFADFEGEWFLEAITSEGVSIPASLFGMSGQLVIREDSLDLSFNDPMASEDNEDGKNVSYEMNGGVISATITSEGETQNVTMEYHLDDCVVVSLDEGNLIFVREENLSSGPSLMDMLSEAFAEGAE